MKKLNEILGTEFPIIQGGMANIATGAFAAAVSNAGAMGLVGAGAMGLLDGDVVFLGCPAEEYIELDFRRALKEAGEIAFFGGKQELLRAGIDVYSDDQLQRLIEDYGA